VALRDATGRPVRFAGSHTDITPRKEAEAELARLNEELVETSRNAGMAEITTGVLHNIGNVLNSANVSSDLVKELIRDSAVGKLAKVVALLREHTTDLGAFLTTDSRGKLIPGYLAELASVLNDEKSRLIAETESLFKNIGHIKDIIITQQNYARLGGAVEDLPVPELIEDALRMNTGSFLRRGVVIHREFQDAPRVRAMRPKVMQILINLFRNANQAMDTAGRTDKVLTIRAGLNGNDRVRIAVSDNGVGIPAGNLDRIFQHGFTTKSDGHGFGLHSCLLAAREMEGNLFVESGGPGLGATFTLELPLTTSKQADPGAKP
jgi:signal transduction histidine kinase